MRKYLIAGNWKMNTTADTAAKLATDIADGLVASPKSEGVEVALFPPFTNIPAVAPVCRATKLAMGAQNCSHEPYGAYTGEISVEMVEAIGCRYVLIGHSERRQIYRENNEWLLAKIKLAVASTVTPILCIGETLEQRQTNRTWQTLQDQLDLIFTAIPASQTSRIVIAYEPVWAIGTGVAATPEEAQEAHAFIRGHLEYRGVEQSLHQRSMILYGGSVNAENAQLLLQQADIDGALIGGASLKAESFLRVVYEASELTKS